MNTDFDIFSERAKRIFELPNIELVGVKFLEKIMKHASGKVFPLGIIIEDREHRFDPPVLLMYTYKSDTDFSGHLHTLSVPWSCNDPDTTILHPELSMDSVESIYVVMRVLLEMLCDEGTINHTNAEEIISESLDMKIFMHALRRAFLYREYPEIELDSLDANSILCVRMIPDGRTYTQPTFRGVIDMSRPANIVNYITRYYDGERLQNIVDYNPEKEGE